MNTVRRFLWLIVAVVSLVLAAGVAYADWLTDSGTVNVQVPNNSTSVVDATTAQGAYVSYFGDGDTTFGSSGTGVFDPFVRLQGAPTEQGYNTNGTTQFDTKVGTWTHAILVSKIPQRPCPQTNSSMTCFELFNDINENNSTAYVSLNKVEVYFTNSATLTGYPFTGSATPQYKFAGDILIHDVNQGSGRADLRYDIPINGPNPITLPANCNFGNPACTTYFVLYSQWGTTTAKAPDGTSYASDGGFEEWKVKIYPAITLSKTPSVTDVCNGSNTQVTYTYVVKNTGTTAVSGPVVDDNGTPGNTADDVTVGTFTSLAPGASQTFTHVFTVNGTRTNVATANATDTSSQTATASATATVTGHNCTISLTKTPSQTSICNGSSVTYSYVVTNNSDKFAWTGSLSDDKLGSIASSVTLAPGASQTFTKSSTITGAVTNTGTASGAFNDPASTTASAQKSATVTGHDCTISLTKTPSQTSVCNGSSVDYSYVVKNNSDAFTWTGSLSDDKLGTINSTITLAPGASQTFTKSAKITGSVTNTATASGAFNDPASTTASAQKSATVVGHDCTISLTKTPSQTNVCNGSPVTYTYVVKNNSDAFTWTGSLSDDKLGSINSSISLSPGQSQTFTASGAINGTVTNTATASGAFNDPSSTSASQTATATVVGHVCTISLTKTPDKTNVCTASNTPVTYTYVVKNTGDFFNASGSVTDDKLGSVGSFGPLAPGASATLTKVGTINNTTTNTATAAATFNDPASTTASATASATVTGKNCQVSQITPTQTTCSDFASGTAATLSTLQYSLQGSTINQVNPGVFFYWMKVTASGASTFTNNQAITTGNFDSHYFSVAAGSNVFNSTCTAVSGTSIAQNGANTTVSFNAGGGGTFYIGIKYSANSVTGSAAPSPTTTVHYDLSTTGVPGSTSGLDLVKK